MCIRDRLYEGCRSKHTLNHALHRAEKGCKAGAVCSVNPTFLHSAVAFGCGKPVSYTHLDVYKRQVTIHLIYFSPDNMLISRIAGFCTDNDNILQSDQFFNIFTQIFLIF